MMGMVRVVPKGGSAVRKAELPWGGKLLAAMLENPPICRPGLSRGPDLRAARRRSGVFRADDRAHRCAASRRLPKCAARGTGGRGVLHSRLATCGYVAFCATFPQPLKSGRPTGTLSANPLGAEGVG